MIFKTYISFIEIFIKYFSISNESSISTFSINI